MSHLRMSTDAVAARSGVKVKKNEYFFTQLFWHAIHHIGGQDLMIEGNFVEPNDRLPMWVMRGIDYAISKGAEAFVAEYHRVDDETPVGMILQLKWGHTLIGAYAVKYKGQV